MKKIITLLCIATGLLLSSATIKSNATKPEPKIYRMSRGHYTDSDGIKHVGYIGFADIYQDKINFKKSFKDKNYIILDASTVKSYLWNSDKYESIGGFFYKRLNQQETKIKIYRKYHCLQVHKTPGFFKYFVSIENHLGITYFWSKKIKNINKNVGTYLTDCPTLQEKIEKKEKGYKYIKGIANLDLWFKIAKEYENCSED